MLDLIVRGANLPDGRTGIDIAVQDGRIVEAAPAIKTKAAQEIDATGRLVTPPFVDAHFHMDSTLSLGQPRMNESGTLLEGIRPRATSVTMYSSVTAEPIDGDLLDAGYWAANLRQPVRWHHAVTTLRQHGVTYAVYGDPHGGERPWPAGRG